MNFNVITYLIGFITVICLQKTFGTMKVQLALILVLATLMATLLATTWAQPTMAEDLTEQDRLVFHGHHGRLGTVGCSPGAKAAGVC